MLRNTLPVVRFFSIMVFSFSGSDFYPYIINPTTIVMSTPAPKFIEFFIIYPGALPRTPPRTFLKKVPGPPKTFTKEEIG